MTDGGYLVRITQGDVFVNPPRPGVGPDPETKWPNFMAYQWGVHSPLTNWDDPPSRWDVLLEVIHVFVGLFKPHGKGTKRTILLGIMICLLPWFVTKKKLAIILRSRGSGVLGWGM